jgi:hypothetical protein
MSLLDDATPVASIPKHLITALYGAPGCGKTILGARTANKTLLVTHERSHVSLDQFPDIAKTVSVITLKSYDHLNGIIRDLYNESHDYDHLMIDTFDGVIRGKLREQLKKIKFTRHPETDELTSLEDYNLLANHMFEFIVKLAKLPISVTVTSHDRIPDPQSYGKGDRLLRPSLPFRVFEILNGYANVVGYMSMVKNREGNQVRAVHLQSTNEFTAKNHLKLGPIVSDDTFVETVRNWKGI